MGMRNFELKFKFTSLDLLNHPFLLRREKELSVFI